MKMIVSKCRIIEITINGNSGKLDQELNKLFQSSTNLVSILRNKILLAEVFN